MIHDIKHTLSLDAGERDYIEKVFERPDLSNKATVNEVAEYVGELLTKAYESGMREATK